MKTLNAFGFSNGQIKCTQKNKHESVKSARIYAVARSIKELNSKLLIIVGILISFIKVECAQKTIKVSNIEISFENKGKYTEFNLKSKRGKGWHNFCSQDIIQTE